MYQPTTRVLALLELLQAHPLLSGAELAARLEVDRRTVRRYITLLGDLGIPIESERGPLGGYRLRRGFKLPPLMFNNAEALALALSLQAARRQRLPLSPQALEGALAKVERVLPAELRARVQAVQALVVAGPQQRGPQPHAELLLAISTAAAENQQLVLRYAGRRGPSDRLVDPYGIAHYWQQWYLVGWCHTRSALRVFRLDRIAEAAPSGAQFARPADFNALEHLVQTLERARWGWEAEILLHTSLERAQQFFSPGSAVLAASAAGVSLRLNVRDLDWLARLLLTLQCEFTIRYPEELRSALGQVAQQAARLAHQR